MRWTSCAAGAILSLLPALAVAQTTPSPASTPSPTTPPSATVGSAPGATAGAAELSGADRRFIDKATIGGMTEIQAGQLAATQAGSDPVKQIGQHMATDHQDADSKLKAIADADGIQRPAGPDAAGSKQLAVLQKLHGQKFDQQYVKDEITAHKQTIALFKTEAASGKNAQLKQFAADTLPTLQQHLDAFQQLNGKS
jgi:putative membrane protein